MTYAEALKRFRSERKLTQERLANTIGVRKEVYQRYEYGRDPSISVLCKIANAFDVSIDYLVGRTDNPARL